MAETTKVIGLPEVTKAIEELLTRYAPKRKIDVIVGYTAQYALWVHEGIGPAVGRPAFFPPVEAFRKWARRKLGDESLAFVVARSVGRKGIPPTKFLEGPAREMQAELGAIIATVTEKFRSLPKGMMTAGLRLQRESQKRVPIDVGNLKGSAFTRQEVG